MLLVNRVPGGGSSSGRPCLPVSSPAASGLYARVLRAKCSEQAAYSASIRAGEQVVHLLPEAYRSPRPCLREVVHLRDPPRGGVRLGDATHLAGSDHLVEGGQRLLDRRAPVGPVVATERRHLVYPPWRVRGARAVAPHHHESAAAIRLSPRGT